MAKPIIKHPGGKRSHPAIKRLPELIAQLDEFNTYIEPMLGGGAMFLSLQASRLLEGKLVILGDADRHLIQLYDAILANPHEVHREARQEADVIATCSTSTARKKAYKTLRSLWNAGARSPGYQLYLRHACFNGGFRLNLHGEMNMPSRDRLDELSLPSVPQLLEFANALEGVELMDWSVFDYEDRAFIGPGSVVFLDPPYEGKCIFREYTPQGFDQDAQIQLIKLAQLWSSRGALVLYCNADTPLIEQGLSEHWSEATVVRFEHVHTMSCDGSRPGIPEVMAYECP